MAVMDEIVANREEILRIAAKCGLKDIKIFGSVARGEETEDSDVDFLVTSDPDSSVGGWAPFGFPVEVEEIIGRRVDMVFEKGLYHMIRDRVLNEARPL